MAQYDGSIRIGTEITTKQAEKELKSLESSISKTADKIASLRSKMDALKDAKIPTEQYKTLSKELEKLVQKQNSYNEQLKEFEGVSNKENLPLYRELKEKLEDSYDSADKLIAKMQELSESGKAFALGEDTEKYAQMAAQMQQLDQQMQSDTQRQTELQNQLAEEEQRLADIKANAKISDQEILDLLERRKQLVQEIADLEKAGVELGYQEYEDANRELGEVNSKIKAYKDNLLTVPEKFSNIQASAQKAFDAVSSGTKKSSGLIATFGNRLKGLAASAFIFNLISKGFNAVIARVKKGFENLTNYSKSYAQSIQNLKNVLSTLGNQFAAAFAPVVQAVIPWLTSLINVISTAIEYVSRFFAILTGKSSYTRAKKVQDSYGSSLGGTAKKEEEVADNADDMSDALDDTSKSAKKAKGALAAFDDLDVLEKQDENADNAALDKIKDIEDAVDDLGGAGGGLDDLFEEVPIDNELPDWLEKILDYLKMLKDIFMEGFWDGLGDWEYRLESIKDSLASIKDSLIDIFTDPAVVAAADKWAQSVAYMLGSLVGSVASIGLTIAANLLGGIASYLEDNKDRIKNHLISMFDVWSEINYMLADFFQSFAYVFEAFASESGIQLTANLIGIFADAFMGITELASKLGRDLLEIIILPFTENKEAFRTALEGFLSVLSEVTETIKQGIDDTFDKLNEVYDAHFKPFFDSVANGLSELVDHFLEFWNGNVQPILDQWAELFDELWTVHIQPMIDNFIELLGGLADMLKALWENILKPLVDWIIDYILPPVLTIIDGIVSAVVIFAGFLADIINFIIDVIEGIVKFLTDVFKGDWEAAWNDIIELFNGSIWEKVKEAGAHFVEGLKEGIKEKWETLKEQVGELGSSIVQKFKDVLGIHSPSTEMKEQGEYTIEGLIEGLESKAGYVSDIWNKLKEDTISILQSMADWISGFGLSISDGLIATLQGIQEQFTLAWTSLYESTVETWTMIQEYFTEFWVLFIESLIETWEEILLIFTENFEQVQLLFEEFITFLNEIFLVSWSETWTMAGQQYQTFNDLLTALTKAVQTMLALFMKQIEMLINTTWKSSWKNAENIFSEFKGKVQEICDAVREIVQSLFDFVMSLVAEMLAGIESVASAAASISTGGFGGGGGASFGGYSATPAMTYSLFNDVPRLASGSVIRGGNPYMAILGDQPRGQTNVETPLDTIKQAVREEMSGMNFGTGNINADMTLDGETVGRLLVPYMIDEMIRQGYDVDVLGVT